MLIIATRTTLTTCYPDTPFFQAFLLTFRSFTNGDELFDRLIERYSLPIPEDLDIDQIKEWKVKKQALIRLRVANALRTWLEKHYVEQSDHGVLDRIEQFAKTTLVANGSELMSKQLLTLVAKRVSETRPFLSPIVTYDS